MWLPSKADLFRISGIKLLVKCDEWSDDAWKNFHYPLQFFFGYLGPSGNKWV
jgi:hypothetical protein